MKSILSTLTILISFTIYSSFAQNDTIGKSDLEKAIYYRQIAKTRSQVDSALHYGTIALEYAKKTKIDSTIMKNTFIMANFNFLKGDTKLVKQYINKYLTLAKKTNSFKDIHMGYMSLGVLANGEGKMDVALDIYKKSLDVGIKNKDSMLMLQSYGAIGNVYLHLNNRSNANEFCLKSLEMCKALNLPANFYNSVIADLAFANDHDFDTAIEYANLAVENGRKNKLNHRDLTNSLYARGRILYQFKHHEKAQLDLKEAYDIFTSRNDSGGLVNLLPIIADNSVNLNLVDEAEVYLNQYFNLSKMGLGTQVTTLQSYYAASEIYSKKKDFEKAYYYADLSRTINDSINSSRLDENFAKYNAEFKAEQKDKEIAEKNLAIEKQKSNQTRIIFIGLALLLLAIILYQWYIQKQKRKKALTDAALIREKEHNEVRTKFLGNIAHEIRTPITLINGYLDLTREDINDSDKALSHLALAKLNSKKVLENANEILDLLKLESNTESIQITNIPITQFCKRVFMAFESSAKTKNITLEFQSSISSSLVIESQENKIEKIINNLVSNALKFSPSHKSIICNVKQIDHNILISITDYGSGIAQQDTHKVFDRFYQTESGAKIGGIGIGLALAKDFSKSLNGDLTVTSIENKETTFMLSFPLIKVENSTLTINEKPKLDSSPQVKIKDIQFIHEEKPRILIVEDNIEMSNYLKEILQPKYLCDIAFNGAEGLEKVQQHKYTLITSDIMMPNMDGFAFKDKVNRLDKTKHIPFIFITAKALDEDKLTGFNLGVDDYVTKPFNAPELIARIETLIHNKRERDNWTKDNLDFIGDSPEEQLLNTIKTIINKNLNNSDFKVTNLASEVGYSQRQLGRIIKKHIGSSPVQYILELRLQYAYKLIINKQHSTLSEIRYAVGINSASHFNKKFEERFGIKPSNLLNE